MQVSWKLIGWGPESAFKVQISKAKRVFRQKSNGEGKNLKVWVAFGKEDVSNRIYLNATQTHPFAWTSSVTRGVSKRKHKSGNVYLFSNFVLFTI